MSSTSDILPPSTESSGNEAAAISARPNPVALQTPINVTGARPGGTAGSRDLFSEDTETVLVFKDGAVIRLSAGVAVGQLLFVTLKSSSQEVVCQVLRKRNYKPTVCFVELQFTEDEPEFWGVPFPEGGKGSAELKLTEHVEAAETTEDGQGTAVTPHRAEDVEALKKQVEALREQLRELEKKTAAEVAAKAVEEAKGERPAPPEATAGKRVVDESENVQTTKLKVETEEKKVQEALLETKGGAPSAEKAPITFSKDKLELAPVNDPSPEAASKEAASDTWRVAREEKKDPWKLPVTTGNTGGSSQQEASASEDGASRKSELVRDAVGNLKGSNNPAGQGGAQAAGTPGMTGTEAPLMPTVANKLEVRRPVIGMALPNRGASQTQTAETKDPTEDLLPKPELDFSKMPQSAVYLDENDPRSIYRKKWVLPANVRIMALRAILVVGAVALVGGGWYGKVWRYLPSWRRSAAPVKSVGTAKPGNTGTAAENGEGVKEPAGATTNAGAKEKAVEWGANTGVAASTDAVERKAAGKKMVGNSEPVAVKKVAAGKEMTPKNKGESAGSKAGEAKVAEATVVDAPLLAAKLLKAATPVYPPDAMRSYITGDVRVEATVEADGSVGEVRVISGPKALRDAAVEALKRYQYAPATQGGKAVASKVTVTVKFWFDP